MVGNLVLCTSVTLTGGAIGNLCFRCCIKELSPKHIVLPLSISAFTFTDWSNVTFKCGLLGKSKNCFWGVLDPTDDDSNATDD